MQASTSERRHEANDSSSDLRLWELLWRERSRLQRVRIGLTLAISFETVSRRAIDEFRRMVTMKKYDEDNARLAGPKASAVRPLFLQGLSEPSAAAAVAAVLLLSSSSILLVYSVFFSALSLHINPSRPSAPARQPPSHTSSEPASQQGSQSALESECNEILLLSTDFAALALLVRLRKSDSNLGFLFVRRFSRGNRRGLPACQSPQPYLVPPSGSNEK